MTAHLRLNFLLTAVTVQSKKDSNKNGKGQERLSQRESLHTDNIKKQGCKLEALNQEFTNLQILFLSF